MIQMPGPGHNNDAANSRGESMAIRAVHVTTVV